MKRQIFTVLCAVALLFILLPGAVLADEGGFTTSSYKVDVKVNENHSYAITETIQVNFTEARHGLYRYIPFKGNFYRQIDGQATETPYQAVITDIQVPGYNFSTSTDSDNTVIKIGDADTTVTGPKTYTISYVWDPGEDGITAFDDVYYNILPANWPTAIDSAAFSITLPKAFNSQDVYFYAGAYGATGSDIITWQANGNTLTGQATRALNANEGITFNLRLPEGYFTGARNGRMGLPIAVAGPLIALAAGLVLYLRLGKKRPLVEPITFHPPHDFTPAEVGYIDDGFTGTAEILSMIIYFAHKGYLTIEETRSKTVPVHEKKKRRSSKSKADADSAEETTFTFHKVKELPANAAEYEKEIFDGLFPNGKTSSSKALSKDFYDVYLNSSRQLKNSFATAERQIFSGSDRILKWVFIALGAVELLIMSYGMTYLPSGIVIIGDWIILYPILCAFPLFLFYKIGQAIADKTFIKMVVFILGSLILSAGGCAIYTAKGIIWPTLLGYAVALALMLLIPRLNDRTPLGQTWLGEINGFRHFIENAEADRIRVLVDEDPAYFYAILPYAYVLHITDQWAKNFEGMIIPPPVWYTGYGSTFNTFNTLMFVNAMNSGLDTMDSSIHDSIPSSSGSGGFGGGGFGGGGGFSGGGGGGGGGGSW